MSGTVERVEIDVISCGNIRRSPENSCHDGFILALTISREPKRDFERFIGAGGETEIVVLLFGAGVAESARTM